MTKEKKEELQKLKIRLSYLLVWIPDSKEYQKKYPEAVARLEDKIMKLEEEING